MMKDKHSFQLDILKENSFKYEGVDRLYSVCIIMHKNQADKRHSKVHRIVSNKSGLELAISTDSQTAGVLILQAPSNYPTNRFIVEDHKDYHIIKSQLTQDCISVLSDSSQKGAVMVTLPNYNKKNQRLYLKKMGQNNSYIVQTFCGLVLDCYEEGDEEGTLIVQWTKTEKSHQLWIFQEI